MTSIKATPIPLDLLQEAVKDKWLGVMALSLDASVVRVGIYKDKNLVGFFTPRVQVYKDVSRDKSGTIYIQPKYRRKGIATEALNLFFADKTRGISYVEHGNTASLKTYLKLGFYKEDVFQHPKTRVKYDTLLLDKDLAIEHRSFRIW